jgi:hypothetical protein
MLVMDRVRHAAILPSAMTARSGPKQCSQNIQKNRCRTTVAEPIGVKLTRFRGARQAFNGGFSDAQDASALFT